jgi:hypothetical protein
MAKNPEPRAVFDADGLPADMATVDRVARLRLAARRLGLDLRLLRVSDELRALLALAGLAGALGVEAPGQPEQREDPLGVQEEGELGDSAA